MKQNLNVGQAIVLSEQVNLAAILLTLPTSIEMTGKMAESYRNLLKQRMADAIETAFEAYRLRVVIKRMPGITRDNDQLLLLGKRGTVEATMVDNKLTTKISLPNRLST